MENTIQLNVREFDEFVVTKGHYGIHQFSAGNSYENIVNYCVNISKDNPTKTIEVTDENVYGTIVIQNGMVLGVMSKHKVNTEHLKQKWFVVNDAMVS